MQPGLNMWSSRLYFWDVPAALLGLGATLVLQSLVVLDHGVVWMGAPVAAVLLRRWLLPSLTPPIDETAPPPSVGRRLMALALIIPGGFVLFLSMLFLVVALESPGERENILSAWPLLIVIGVGGSITAMGVRIMTTYASVPRSSNERP
ncbi:MAG: hypothetical protein BGO98_42370 [Myxococcales bacterium 68-20]|nr:hypothetical protein [Myxococcales bacterium]OJY29043.1 MAG: hypothetical protein BGO98_42370 [Myxococcales bacterium 68-20]